MWRKALAARATALLAIVAQAFLIGCGGNPSDSRSLIDAPQVAGETLWYAAPDDGAAPSNLAPGDGEAPWDPAPTDDPAGGLTTVIGAPLEVMFDPPANADTPPPGGDFGPPEDRVQDPENQPPVANANSDQTVADSDANGSEPVTLNGYQSHDPDGTIVGYRWSEGADVLYDGPGAMTAVVLPLGVHAITLLVTDNGGLMDTDELNVTVLAGGMLSVTPPEDFYSSGIQGGPFSSDSKAYTLTNTGSAAIQWTAAGAQSWLTLFDAVGSLQPGATVVVTVSINSDANGLANGNYSDTVAFVNVTNGQGDTARAASLSIDPLAGVLTVTPADNLSSGGRQGGPFDPNSRTYTLTNSGGQALDWVAVNTQAWVTLSAAGGALAPGHAATVTATINANANSLAAGDYADEVQFGNQTNHDGDTARGVLLTVLELDEVVISGHVADGGGTAISGVTIGGLPGNPSTNGGGDYSATVNYGFSGTATPSKAGYTFSPPSRTYANVTSNQTSQGYAGALSGCYTSTASWQNVSFATQSGVFTAELDALPNDANMDGITGVSMNAGASYSDFAILVRFNETGTIDARNGGVYSAGATIAYSAGTNYHFRLVVNVPSHTYSIYVTPQGGGEQTLGTNYAFRTEQNGVTSLGNWALIAGSGSHQVCNFTMASGGGPGTLVVAPADGLSSSGTPGGPFAPSSKDYLLTNAGGQTIAWTASKTQTWVSLSGTGGNLAAGASATVTVSLNSGANSLPNGNYSDVVSFTNTTNGGGDTARAVALTISSGTQMASSVTQFGITWTFSQSRPVGQFANGDWWVVGPVTISAITKPHGSNGKDGSMVNPRPSVQGTTHGYDDQVGDYQAALDVSRSLPYTLAPNASLVSVISWVAGDPGCPGLNGGIPRPNLRSCAVLTCLASAPPSGTLRPPYCGTSKPLYNTAQLRRDLLVRLPLVASTPAMASVEQNFERIWLDHVPNWPAQDYMHPSENMPWYGREIAGEIGDAALMLLLDRSDKETLLVRYVQLGIDFYGIASNGGYWSPNGGIAHGRKWPILFAGLMLDNANMLNIGTSVMFQEDGQSFYVEETSPGVYNWGYGGYGAGDVGLPEWGIRHATVPSMDNKSWDADYRDCCTNTALVGQVLAARILGLRATWGHEALFDYQDRYMETEVGDFRAWSDFAEQMWDQYRPDY